MRDRIDLTGPHGATPQRGVGTVPFSQMAFDKLEPKAWFGGLLALIFLISIVKAHAAAGPTNPSSLETLVGWMPFILTGFVFNLVMSVLAMALATFLGTIMGLLEVSPSKLTRLSIVSFMQVFRNTPWIVILFAVMLLIPFRIKVFSCDILLPDWVKATIGLSLPVAANIAEVVRGAILSIPVSQWESAESLAFSRRQTMWLIILPQCIKRMIPPWMNWYAILALSTPITAILGVHEAVGNAQQAMEAAGARTSNLLPFYSFILLLFFAYIYPISRLAIWLEKKYAVKA